MNNDNISIPPSPDCTVYPTYGPKTTTTDFICGLQFDLTAECVSVNAGSGASGSSGNTGIVSLSDYIIITINITKKNIDSIPPYIIVQVELVDPKGSVIKPFDNDAIMTGDSISFNIPRPPCPNNPNIFLEVGNISARLVLPCDGEISGSCSGSDSGSASGSASGFTDGSLSDSGSSGLGYDILFDKTSWESLVSSPTKTYLNTAADIWRSIATINPEVTDFMRSTNPDWNGITLNNYIPYTDPFSTVVAYCSLNSAVIIDGIAFNSTAFTLGINFAYGMNASAWITVLVHELGHALGIGFWSMNPQNWLDGSIYTETLTGYKIHIGGDNLGRHYIPIEDTGGIGSVGAHWEDNNRVPPTYNTPDDFTYPGIDDVMNSTVDLNSPYIISGVSRSYLKDLQYSVSNGLSAGLVLPQVSVTNNANLQIAHKWCGCGDHCSNHQITILGDLSQLNS